MNKVSHYIWTDLGDVELLSILAAVNSRMGSIALVHVEDICSAHIFLMENAKAEGRYMCCAQNCSISELIAQLSQEYPVPATHRFQFLPYLLFSEQLTIDRLVFPHVTAS